MRNPQLPENDLHLTLRFPTTKLEKRTVSGSQGVGKEEVVMPYPLRRPGAAWSLQDENLWLASADGSYTIEMLAVSQRSSMGAGG